MSVLSRRHTVPTQRAADPREDLAAPRPTTRTRVAPPAPAQVPARRRAALLVGATVLAAAAGTAVYVVADGGASEPAAPVAPPAAVDGPATSSTEIQRDAAMARRGPGPAVDGNRTTEALRDAAAASRGGTQPGAGGQAGQTATTQSGGGLIP